MFGATAIQLHIVEELSSVLGMGGGGGGVDCSQEWKGCSYQRSITYKL